MGRAKDVAYAYVDGSYNYDTNRYGCGGILVVNGKNISSENLAMKKTP